MDETATPTGTSAGRRPAAVTATVGVLLALGVSALGGGIEMLVFRDGGRYLPSEWLDEIPLVDSYVAPGLVLGTVFGAGSLGTAVGMLQQRRRRAWHAVERATGRHWSWASTVALGVGFTGWLSVEIALLGGPRALDAEERAAGYATYAVFGSVAAALLTLPHTRAVRRHLALDR
jgi:hypothetical protein